MLDKLSKDQEVNPMAGDKKTIDIKKNQSSNAVIESSESKIAPKVNVSIKRKTIDDALRESIEPKIDAKLDVLNKEQRKEKEEEFGVFLYRKHQVFSFFENCQKKIIKYFFILFWSSLGFILLICVPQIVFILLKILAILLVIRFVFFPLFFGLKLFKKPRSFF